MTLLDDVIEAHGGLARWRRTGAIRLQLSSGGLAFTSKGQSRALHELTATVSTTGQTVELSGRAGTYRFDTGIPRPRGVRWSAADIAAFAATALWTYVSLPFRLVEFDVTEHRRRLVVHFGADVRTHCPTQVLHIDDAGLIRRHDYTALDFGRWAVASQTLDSYREFGGLLMATRRRVHPRLWPHLPRLVWIDVHDAAVIPG